MTPKEHEIIVGAANKNMGIFKDKDRTYKHREITWLTTHIPKGDITNEVLYNKMCSNENLVTTGFRDIHLEIDEIKQNQILDQEGSDVESEDESD